MKTFCSLLVLVLAVSSPCLAKQAYNAFENRWETVPDEADVSPRYNAFENEFSMQTRDADLQYNAFENRFEWDSGHNLE